MSRLLLAALLIFGVWPPQPGTNTEVTTPIPGFFDLAVTGGTATYEALGLAPEERGTAIAILAREFHGQGTDRGGVARLLESTLGPPAAPRLEMPPGSQPITIAAPLTADHWRDVLELPGRADLFPALIASRPALITCAAVLSADASLRRLLDRDRNLLRWLGRTAPGAFMASVRGLRVENDRIAVPGGTPAVPIWEAITGERVARPAEFIRALVTQDSGRLA
ncbi:MAG TPA: hypothetical protein VF491_24740, partial [Vicinamibacterales bacterium]